MTDHIGEANEMVPIPPRPAAEEWDCWVCRHWPLNGAAPVSKHGRRHHPQCLIGRLEVRPVCNDGTPWYGLGEEIPPFCKTCDEDPTVTPGTCECRIHK